LTASSNRKLLWLLATPLDFASGQRRVNAVAGVGPFVDGQSKMVRYLRQLGASPPVASRPGAPRFAGQTSASVDGEIIHKSRNDIIIK